MSDPSQSQSDTTAEHELGDTAFMPSSRFGEALSNAETLLKFAAEEGISIPVDIVSPIIEARMRYGREGFQKRDLMAFFSSLTALASILKPVTASSIKACESKDTGNRLLRDRKIAISFTVVALVFSAIAFINQSFSARINEDVTNANKLAVELRAGIPGGLDPKDTNDPCNARKSTSNNPISIDADRLTKLQTFAALSREVYKQSLKFNFFINYIESDPYDASVKPNLELDPAVLNYQSEVFCKILLYEKARDFSRNVVLDNGYIYGAISQYVLPVIYALVGAYAFRLRSFSETVRRRTYHPSFADSARLTGALIVGSVISLFNLFTQGASLSPLAIAFLAGYAVEVFFSLLDALVQTISRRDGPTQPSSSITIFHADRRQTTDTRTAVEGT
jgi:hypothetical protein